MHAKKRVDVRLHIAVPLWWPSLPSSLGKWWPARSNVAFTLLVAAGLLWVQTAGAFPHQASAAPGPSTSTVAYQGRLADASGNPLTGTLPMVFRLYTAAAGGEPVWMEHWDGVEVRDGLFNVMLGSLSPITPGLTGRPALYLGVKVGADDEMAPRMLLGSAPFAVQALAVPDGSVTTAKLEDRAVTQAKLAPDVAFAPPDGSVTTAKLADGAVTTAKIANGSITPAKLASDPSEPTRLVTSNPPAVTMSAGSGWHQAVGDTGISVTVPPGQVYGYVFAYSGVVHAAKAHADPELYLHLSATLLGDPGEGAPITVVQTPYRVNLSDGGWRDWAHSYWQTPFSMLVFTRLGEGTHNLKLRYLNYADGTIDALTISGHAELMRVY